MKVFLDILWKLNQSILFFIFYFFVCEVKILDSRIASSKKVEALLSMIVAFIKRKQVILRYLMCEEKILNLVLPNTQGPI
jgi:hypothetical protein